MLEMDIQICQQREQSIICLAMPLDIVRGTDMRSWTYVKRCLGWQGFWLRPLLKPASMG